MSSHHIIREMQEPALIIANGQACSQELIGELLEWSPLVIVLDRAASRVIDMGIKIDVLLGDFDNNFDAEALRQHQFPMDIVHTPDQSLTDLEKAFEYLISKKHTAANIVWATGKRADHTFANISNMARYRRQLKLVMIDDHSTIFPINNTFEKWYEAKTPLSLLPLGDVSGISTQGLRYNLSNDTLKLGYKNGNSNQAIADGFVKINYQTGDLLLMECWD